MRIYTLYKSFTATADAAANFMVVAKGRIKCVVFSVGAQLNADAEFFHVEVGAVPTIQSRTNDSVGAIAICKGMCGLLTSGANQCGYNLIVPVDYPVEAQDKIYLHGVLTGTTSVDCSALVYVV